MDQPSSGNRNNPRLFLPIDRVSKSNKLESQSKAEHVVEVEDEVWNVLKINPTLKKELKSVSKRLINLGRMTYTRVPTEKEKQNTQGRGYSHHIDALPPYRLPLDIYVKGIGSASIKESYRDPESPGFSTGDVHEAVFYDQPGSSHLRTWGNNTIRWCLYEYCNLAVIFKYYTEKYGISTLEEVFKKHLPFPVGITEFHIQNEKKKQDFLRIRDKIITQLTELGEDIKFESLSDVEIQEMATENIMRIKSLSLFSHSNEEDLKVLLWTQLRDTYTKDNRFASIVISAPSSSRVGDLYHGYSGEVFQNNLLKTSNSEVVTNFAQRSRESIINFGVLFSGGSCHVQNVSDNPNSIFPFFDYSDLAFLGLYP